MTNDLSLPAGFETAEAVQRRRSRLVGQLVRAGNRKTAILAHTIAGCASNNPCGSGACPACQRAWRLAMLAEANAALHEAPLLRLSWVPAGAIVRQGQLASIDLPTFIASRRRALQRALPGVVGFGGADVSLNTTDNDAGIWQLHLYLIVEADDTQELREAIRARCAVEPSAPRPLHFMRVFNRLGACTYAMKASAYRRSSYVDALGRRNTQAQCLKAAHTVEVALYQATWPPATRLLLCGLRQYHGLDGPRLLRL